MRQLSGQDASFLYMESQGAYLHLTALYIYDQSTVPGGIVRHKDILRYIESRLHTSPIFRQKLVSLPLSVDYPYWVDDERFDLEFHVRHIALPEPRDWRQLCILVARLHSRPLDMQRPPWEMYVVEGLDNIEGIPKGAFALISKYHHAAIDGASGAELLAGLHSVSPEYVAEPEVKPWAPKSSPSMVELLARAAVNNVKTPFQLTKAVAATLPGLSRLSAKGEHGALETSDNVPRTRFNGPVSPHRAFEGIRFDLKRLAAIRKAVPGATVNDVVLTICGGALRKYLVEKGELPPESLTAMAPINTRPRGEAVVAGNKLAAMLVPLYTDIADPLARLRSIKRETSGAKETRNAVGARQMTDLMSHTPAVTLALAGRLITGLGLAHRTFRLCNCTITNVPGPQQPWYLNGAKLLLSTGAAPVIDGMGLIITAISYNGDMVFSFTACRRMLPDPEFLRACASECFDSLENAAKTRLDATAKPTARKTRATKKAAPKKKAKKSRAKASRATNGSSPTSRA
jgi:WS/DGAT/MGAT family acyltransferase